MGNTSSRSRPQAGSTSFLARLFAALTGVFLALALWKFGNPAIFESTIEKPNGLFELLYQPWPVQWGYSLLAVLAFVGLFAGKLEFQKDWKSLAGIVLPLIWLGWQFVAATQTVDVRLTTFTLKHFVACAVCFYLGRFALGRVENLRPVWLGLLAGLIVVIWTGWSQHFGGLERTRQFFYELPNWREFRPDFIKKIGSNRIYATLFYPNTLAAVLLLVLPICLVAIWSAKDRLTTAARGLLVGLIAISAVACLVWSGSKSGWLLAMLLGLIVLLRLNFDAKIKKGVILALLVLGLGGFFWKYASFFQRGATSVVARFDYWRAASQITAKHPMVGTGPGTFYIPYSQIKRPEAEITRLCHNDYLEQASDSGLIGFLSFTAFIFGSLVVVYPGKNNFLAFSVWLGLVGVCLHSLVEFNLYIPAVAWPMFLLLGWLWSQRNQFDKPAVAS